MLQFFTAARKTFAAFRTRMCGVIAAVIAMPSSRQKSKEKIRNLEQQLDEAWKRITAMERDEESARCQLCQLRVVPESVRDRTGFMVSAFVPDAALKRLRSSPTFSIHAFRDRVLRQLLDRALHGLFRVTKNGNMCDFVLYFCQDVPIY